MMDNRNGFTLLELLIAAAIIATLAVFATQTFRQSASEVRLQDAQARAKIIAMAAHRLKVDYPTATFSTAPMGIVSLPNRAGCYPTQEGITLQMLINCGYLDYRQYAVDSREEDEDEDAEIFGSNFDMHFFRGSYKVCVKAKEQKSKILDKRCYCTDGETIDAPVASCSD